MPRRDRDGLPLNGPGRGTMDKHATDRGRAASGKVSRRAFLSTGAAGVALVGTAQEAMAQGAAQRNWDRSADVVVIGAGVAGLPAAVTARDYGASVIVVDENYDIGGRGILSGGRVPLGGGHALPQKAGTNDSAPPGFSAPAPPDTPPGP